MLSVGRIKARRGKSKGKELSRMEGKQSWTNNGKSDSAVVVPYQLSLVGWPGKGKNSIK